MIDFQDQRARPASILFFVSIFALAGAALYAAIAKKPAVNMAARKKQIQQYQIGMADAQKMINDNKEIVDKNIWKSGEERVGPELLRSLNDLASHHKVKLSAFRPQRPFYVENMTQLIYQVTVDGTYLEVLGFANDIEKSAKKYALTQFNLASTDASSDKVSATLGLVAYSIPAEKNKK
ncbi:MAG: type 4a pilus biogenesis protein PilO [Armatimonadetes bacterium]|nr:type 4a pilus biogenesis protein PilO [Armatimonadota bacterium]